MTAITIVLAAAAFALLAGLGLAAARYVCAGIEPFPDGPPPQAVPVNLLIGGCALLGAVAAFRGIAPPGLAVLAVACFILVAIWSSDVTRGIVPDVFTVIPLAAMCIAALIAGHWETLIAAIVPALPFAFLAWRSKGNGLGWGDVKLAALGGPLLGMQYALLAFAVGCCAAVVVARARGSGGTPVAFAPYLASAIAVPLALLTPAH